MLLKSVICKNGHRLSTTLKQNEKPLQSYCPECGEPVLDNCEHCKKNIPGGELRIQKFGNLYDDSLTTIYEDRYEATTEIPNFCIHCGKPYPWTENFLKDYNQLLELNADEINEQLREIIFNSTQSLLKDRFSSNSIHVQILKKSFAKIPIDLQETLVQSMVKIAGDKIISLFK